MLWRHVQGQRQGKLLGGKGNSGVHGAAPSGGGPGGMFTPLELMLF